MCDVMYFGIIMDSIYVVFSSLIDWLELVIIFLLDKFMFGGIFIFE